MSLWGIAFLHDATFTSGCLLIVQTVFMRVFVQTVFMRVFVQTVFMRVFASQFTDM